MASEVCHIPIRVPREGGAAAKLRRLRSCRARRAMAWGALAMNRIRLPLALSIAGHAVVLALLILFAAATRPSPETAMPGGFEVVLGQMLPDAKTPPAPQALPSQAAAVRQPEPTVEATEPAPAPVPEFPVLPPDQTAAVTAPPPPRRKPAAREPP